MKSNRFNKKALMCMLVAVILISLPVYSVSAYRLEGWYLEDMTTSYTWGSRLDGGPSTMRYAWEDAADDWYNATGEVEFYYSSRAQNYLDTVNDRNSNECGYTNIQLYTDGYVAFFDSYINVGHTIISTGDNAPRSTAGHEFGHVLGLAHYSSSTVLMGSNRNRERIYVPYADDINGFEAIYY